MAYSGGGYFRLIPFWLVNRVMKQRGYNICYFHLADLLRVNTKMMSKAEYEEYFKEPGTLKNRLMRYVKSNAGTGDIWEKLKKLLSEHPFINLKTADSLVDWKKESVVYL